MGALLAISLFFTLLAAFIVVPAFLGPPPSRDGEERGGGALTPIFAFLRPRVRIVL
jgi:hypothetical protein